MNIAVLFFLLILSGTCQSLTVDCNTFDPATCIVSGDTNRFCFTDGVIAANDCEAKTKICNENNNSAIDDTWAACGYVATTTKSNGGNSPVHSYYLLVLLIYAGIFKIIL